jgi:outer membrane biosynthesis protein TonB
MEATMKALIRFARLLGIGCVGLPLLLAGACQKEEEKKEPAPKAEPAPVKKAEPAQEEKKVQPAAEQKQEPPPKVVEPSPAQRLEAARKAFPAYSQDPGAVEKHLAALDEIVGQTPEAPEAFAAYKEASRTRLDFLLLAQAGTPELEKRLLLHDQAIPAGAEPTDEAAALYLRTLSGKDQQWAEKAQDPADKARLRAQAALLFYLSQVKEEAAGKLAGNTLVLPADWLRPRPDQPEAKTPADKSAAAEPAPEIRQGGADPSALLALTAADGPVALQARYFLLSRVALALQKASSTQFAARWVQIADGIGKTLCAACGQLGTVKEQYLDEVLFLAGNAGLVCPKASEEVKAGTPVPEALVRNCFPELGLGPEDALLATPVNALVLRTLALTASLLDKPPEGAEKEPLFPAVADVAKALGSGMPTLVALFPTLQLFPKEKWEEMKDQLVLQSDLSPLSPAWEYQPLEAMVTDEKGVSNALRPLALTQTRPVTMAEKEGGLAFPGKLILDVPGIEAELAAKNEQLKAQKAPYDEKLGAFLFEVTIRGTKFMKPDFSIPSVVTAAGALAQTAGPFEGRAYPYLAEKQVLNFKRPEWPEFKDTVGRAALYATDRETPALLFKRVVDSLYFADYKDDRLMKGTGPMDTVPTVYFTEKFVEPTVLDVTYKRPLLAYVTEEGTVRFYPPTDRTSKGKATPTRNPRRKDIEFPAKFRTQIDPREIDPLWNLFMAYTSVRSADFEKDVQGIAAAMKKKWDNGNVMYVVADDKAQSGWVIKVADLLARLPDDPPFEGTDKAFPGYACDPQTAPELCITNIVVIFPDVEIPYLPGSKKVKEVEAAVYCDQKDIAAKINAKKGAIKFCYDPELQKNPNLQGKVVYGFTIGAEGKITQIAVDNDGLGNTTVVNCAMEIIKKINFRRPIGGECVIRYPYVFKP